MSSQIGELLVRCGRVTPDQLSQAAQAQSAHGGFVGTHLVNLGCLSETELIQTISHHLGVQIVELEEYSTDNTVLQLIPQQLAQKHQLVPLSRDQQTLVVAMVDPSNITALNDVKFITGLDLRVMVAPEKSVHRCLERVYEQSVSYDTIISDFDPAEIAVVESSQKIDLDALERATEDAPVVKLVNAILTDAIKRGASDIHIEPYEKVFRIRFRIDGVLYEIMNPPAKLKNAITSRIKIMAELDIAERRLPQDGRIKLKLGGQKEMDFRVNVLPTLFGEKVVMRLLDKSNLQLDMTKLGFEVKQLADFKEAIAKPHGMVLVTGPTGSGKTTTLYSAIAELNQIGTNISTAEDPVEFNLAGINQAQIHEDIGFTFAAALRAFMRQDPDVIMVGEIRDYETAEIAIKASLTGHMVLSTLHTNDAPSTVNRLLNMGVEPFLVASSINLILAQRLARRVCSSCCEEITIHPETLVSAGIPVQEATQLKLKRGRGCDRCSNTGYKGRIALYEVMPMSEELRQLVLNGASATEIKREAIRLGMLTLRQSGLMRMREGVTTLEEVMRVTAGD
ncbi:MAG: type IV-A pilus assembly ATPase PilB [Proteobacteria bacterium]|nr:type IV-A pilus assembly ATPase PilB [Pseudomonadota bacterium]